MDECIGINEVADPFGPAFNGTFPTKVPLAKAPPADAPPIVSAPVSGPPLAIDDQGPQDPEDNESFGKSADREKVGSVRGRGIGYDTGGHGSRCGGRDQQRERKERQTWRKGREETRRKG